MTIYLCTEIKYKDGKEVPGFQVKCTSFFCAKQFAEHMKFDIYEIKVMPEIPNRKITRSPPIADFKNINFADFNNGNTHV